MKDFFDFEIILFRYNFRHYFPHSDAFFRARTAIPGEVVSFRSILQFSNRKFGPKKTIVTNLVYLFLFLLLTLAIDVGAYFLNSPFAVWGLRIAVFFLLLWKFDVFRLIDAYSFLITCFSLFTLLFSFYFSISLVFIAALTNYVAFTREKEEIE